MNIHDVKQGTRVRYANPNAGLDYEIRRTKRLLILNRVYTIEKTVVHNFHTDVYLEDFNVPFNSVHFNDIDDDGKHSGEEQISVVAKILALTEKERDNEIRKLIFKRNKPGMTMQVWMDAVPLDANLAMRLRDEAVERAGEDKWTQTLYGVFSKDRVYGANKYRWQAWLLCYSQPYHYILTACEVLGKTVNSRVVLGQVNPKNLTPNEP